jgi:hypothetical protein
MDRYARVSIECGSSVVKRAVALYSSSRSRDRLTLLEYCCGLDAIMGNAPVRRAYSYEMWTTTSRTRLAVTAAAALWMTGCSQAASPVARAASVEQAQCGDATSVPEDLAILRDTTVLSIEPTYVVDTCWGTWQVSGTKLLMSPPQGVPPERLARVLRCHGARALLRRADASMVDDPYWSPDGWVDIEATSVEGRLAVLLRADTVQKNIHLLRRATAFAALHRLATTNTQ